MLFEINDCDIGTFFCKGDGNGAAIPTVAAGNDCDFVSQFSAAAMFFILCLGPRLHLMLATRSPSLVLTRLKFLFSGHSSSLPTQLATIFSAPTFACTCRFLCGSRTGRCRPSRCSPLCMQGECSLRC